MEIIVAIKYHPCGEMDVVSSEEMTSFITRKATPVVL